MSHEIFLWPQPQPVRLIHFFGGAPTDGDIEARLRALYPGCEPVLFSSARAGLRAILEHLGLSRPDLVWCPPFSSHCVFDAVSRVATPTTTAAEGIRTALIYHQWGHVHGHDFPAGTSIIEDAVDTLFVPGSSPFAVDGRFVLWSLPKVVACQWGGVVFCRCQEDAAALRRLRNGRPLPAGLQALLRVLGEKYPTAASYWHGAEAGGGTLPTFALRHIAEGLDRLPSEVEARRQHLALLQPCSLVPPPSTERLPSNLPVPADSALDRPLASGQVLTAGLRSFNLDRHAPAGLWSRVFPAPIHQDLSGTDIAEIAARVIL